MSSWVVHKFGGTSVADAERYQNVANIVRADQRANVGVVVSAMAKVTDALLETCALAAKKDESYAAKLDAIATRHHDTAAKLLAPDAARAMQQRVDDDVRDLKDILRASRLLGNRADTIDEYVSGHGELWSAQMLAAHLGVPFVDARKALVVRPSDLGPSIDWDESKRRTSAIVGDAKLVVITGFIASTPEGAATTLGRNGSDFSASIFGALLDAGEVVIWTDVDGVLSADPRRVPEAVLLDEMSYREAMELAYFGAKVVHPRTMQPAVDKHIPIWIKNTFRPEVRGTVIHDVVRSSTGAQVDGPVVKGFTTIDDIALLNLEGTGMVGVPGVAERLFGALRAVGVSVIVISQASSEHSICFAVKESQSDLARDTVTRAFASERAQGMVSDVVVERGCSVLAAVGDAMAERPGVAARFFSALADVGVNVRAVAQGSSERNITAVIARSDSTRALRAVHSRFTLSDTTISLAVVGAGLIGKSLLQQIEAQREELKTRHHVDLRVRALCDSKRMVLGEDVSRADVSTGEPIDLDKLAAHVRAEHMPHAAVVDCTANDAIADRYAAWLSKGIHVVTPNKRAAAGPLSRWSAIKSAVSAHHSLYLGEATVGAGLPVVKTLQDLMLTGDRVKSVDGVLSGTLSFIFNNLEPGAPFSAAVREARRLGYTEPDPREDLSGLDFARKLVVLAREMGRAVSLEDVVVEDLAPGLAFGLAIDDLIRGLADVDQKIAARQREAQAKSCVLRYAGSIPESGAPRIELRAVPLSHPFARLTGTDNIVAFTTKRYDPQPLLVQGPGAGPEVTAGGVFADLLRLAAHLGAAI